MDLHCHNHCQWPMHASLHLSMRSNWAKVSQVCVCPELPANLPQGVSLGLTGAGWLRSHLPQLRGTFRGLAQEGDLAAVLRLRKHSSFFVSSLWFWRSPVFSGKDNGGSLGTTSASLWVKSRANGWSQELAWLVCHTEVVGNLMNPVPWCLTLISP